MKTAIKLCLIVVFCTGINAIAKDKQITWGTDEWKDITNSDGSGLYHELINKIYRQQGYDLTVSYYPWQRVLHSLSQNKIDMTGGLPERQVYFQSSQPVLSQKIVLVMSKDKAADFDIDNIKQYRGSWRKGYEEDIVHRVIPPPVTGTYIEKTQQALNFILSDKVDYYVDIEDIVTREVGEQIGDFEVLQVGYFHLYWTFANNEKGMELKHQFDHMWAQLYKSGEIEQLYNKYNIKLPEPVEKLRCGLSDGYPPYQFKDSQGLSIGFDVDLFRDLMKSSKLEIELFQANWDDVVPELRFGKQLDCVLGMEITPERLEMFDFSIPYAERKTALFTLAENEHIQTVEDLVGKKITGDKQSSLEQMLKQKGLYKGFRIKYPKTKEQAFQLLLSKDYLAMVAPKEVGLYLAKKYNTPIRIVLEMTEPTQVAIAVKKGNAKLKRELDQKLQQELRRKRVQQIYQSWFNERVLPE